MGGTDNSYMESARRSFRKETRFSFACVCFDVFFFFFLKDLISQFEDLEISQRGMKYDCPHLGSSPSQGAYKCVRSAAVFAD